MSKLSAFKKALEKKEIKTGLPPIESWLAFPNLAMNWVCTGSFRRAIPHRRSVLIGGESGATKTMNILQLASLAQAKGYHVILLDSETAISAQDLKMNKVNTDDEHFTVIAVTTHEETLDILNAALSNFEEDDKIMFILDSMTGLMTTGEDENFDKGKKTNDMGRMVQENKKLLKFIGNRIRHRDWFFLTTCHVYLNQDLLNGKGKYIFSNVGAAMYYPSLTLQLTKLDLKDGQDQIGIRVDFTTKKNRFYQLGKKVRLELPYMNENGGFAKYDGVIDILKEFGYINQSGAWYSFERETDDGEIETIKFQSKNFDQYAEELIERYEKEHAGDFVEQDEDEANLEMVEHDV